MLPTLPPVTSSTRTTTRTNLQFGECTFWGDPHLKTFDGARPSFYGDGEYYIVKSDHVIIQGRYMGTIYTDGLAATNKVAVGGEFLKGHSIEVGCLECGDITVDGIPVLGTLPSTYHLEDLAVIDYSDQGLLVDEATSIWQKRVVHMHLPLGVQLTVFRWANYVDLRLVMQPQPNQDGSCGNFNSDPSDDTTQAIFSRIGARVPKGELLFQHRAEVNFTEVEQKLLAMCAHDRFQAAEHACMKELAQNPRPGNPVLAKSCMLDYCFGSNEHVLRLVKSLGLHDAQP